MTSLWRKEWATEGLGLENGGERHGLEVPLQWEAFKGLRKAARKSETQIKDRLSHALVCDVCLPH